MLVLLLAGLCAASGLPMVDDADDSFVPLRPPVLGYRIEWSAGRDEYRLVRVGGDKVLATGTQEACEKTLVERLESAWGTGHPNLAFATPGGLQFWGDVFWFAGLRIQENVYTGHYRLLDPSNVRRAWGGREACRTAFEGIRVREGLRLEGEHLVVLVHGLGRTRDSLNGIQAALDRAGYITAGINYPSTRRTLAEHAAQLTAVLDRLEGVQTVSFVTHSLGGLVVRAALAQDGAWESRLQVGRLVMLAPPSSGSSFADAVDEFLPAQILLGPAAHELAMEEIRNIPSPDCSFGIIAAGGPGSDGWNPLLEGDDDGVVSVEETRLEGADDFLLVRGLHTFLMKDDQVIQATLRFLETGSFSEPAEADKDP